MNMGLGLSATEILPRKLEKSPVYAKKHKEELTFPHHDRHQSPIISANSRIPLASPLHCPRVHE